MRKLARNFGSGQSDGWMWNVEIVLIPIIDKRMLRVVGISLIVIIGGRDSYWAQASDHCLGSEWGSRNTTLEYPEFRVNMLIITQSRTLNLSMFLLFQQWKGFRYRVYLG